MATKLATLEAKTREFLMEPEPSFWSSPEIISYLNSGIKNLWAAVVDLHREHFFTIDTGSASIAADGTSIAGVPDDVFRILSIEPVDLTTGVKFTPLDYQEEQFKYARSLGSQSASNLEIFYAVTDAGPKVGAPTIYVAPAPNATLAVRLIYAPTVPTRASTETNPIPGESDNALIAWAVAYALSKEREDRMPDPAWLAVYATEKQTLLTTLTPRQSQESEVVEDVFKGW